MEAMPILSLAITAPLQLHNIDQELDNRNNYHQASDPLAQQHPGICGQARGRGTQTRALTCDYQVDRLVPNILVTIIVVSR